MNVLANINPLSQIWLCLLLCAVLLLQCKTDGDQATMPGVGPALSKDVYQMQTPLWERNATVMVLNIGTYTSEGTYLALIKHLPQLKKMGVQTLALRQVCPLGFGKDGRPSQNPSAVSDFTKVNPDFGTFEEFRKLSEEIDNLRMHLIIEWEPNHTSKDHSWTLSNPEWYVHINDTITHAMNASGIHTEMRDVAELDYSQSAVRSMMIESMRFWIRSCNVDGFFISHADLVPTDFWNMLRPQLDAIKPMLLISNSALPTSIIESSFQGFMDRNWTRTLEETVLRKSGAGEIRALIQSNIETFGAEAYPVNWLDTRSLKITQSSASAVAALSVISATVPGMIMIEGLPFNGNPAAIAGVDDNFYLRLLQLKLYNEALWNGDRGGLLTWLNEDDDVLAFSRVQSGQQVIVIVNCSDKQVETIIDTDARSMNELFTGTDHLIRRENPIPLMPWEFRVYANPSIELEL
ncbi:MAG: alpha-amylase family glycosyl hydrolase [Saprospiraceae bacterium]|nr:alpha-amylase family glycosyl hydrolase [Saprospiraceae bacterium]